MCEVLVSISSTSEEVQSINEAFYRDYKGWFPLVQLPKKFKAEAPASVAQESIWDVSISSTSEEVQRTDY